MLKTQALDKMNSRESYYGGPSFLIKIQYCRDANWQGTVQWLEAKQEQKFRSLLELIMLMQESAGQSRTGQQGVELRTWKISEATQDEDFLEKCIE